MSSESESVNPSPPVPAPGAKKKKKKPKIARALTESEINAPDMQTLGMVGIMAALSITLWIFAHAGCNYHPPRETRRPRNVTTQELVRDPKGAAIEFQQRLLTHDYKGALEIAGGPLVKDVEKAKAACDADAAGCAAKKKAAADAITMAVVLDRDASSAKVRVTTLRLPGGTQTSLALAEREVGTWRVTARIPDGPDAKLPPPSLPQAAPVQMVPMPLGPTPNSPNSSSTPAAPPQQQPKP